MSSIRETFVETLYEVGKKDDKLVLIISDISHGRLKNFRESFPDRYFNVGICENTCINMTTGLSALGFYPVVHTFTSFIVDRSYEQLKLGFGYQKLGGNILAIGGALDYPMHGCTHHTYGDFALIKTIENSEMLYPGSPIEFDELFKQTYNNNKLTVTRLISNCHNYQFKREQIKVGKGILVKEGEDITIITSGPFLDEVIKSTEELKKYNIDPEIIHIHTIKPLDEEMIQNSLKKTKKCLIIDEHSKYGSLTDDILRCTTNIGIKYDSINLGDKFIHEYGTYTEHCNRLGFNKDNIVKKCREL